MSDNGLRLEWLDPKDLADNPRNWRTHKDKQASTLKAAIDKVGWAGTLLYNERTKRLIDGHLRKHIFEGGPVPVLIGSWTEEQERFILVTLDPLAAMAEADDQKLGELLASVQTESEAVQAMLEGLAEGIKIIESPEEFPEVDEQIETDHECPKCGYKWSGGK